MGCGVVVGYFRGPGFPVSGVRLSGRVIRVRVGLGGVLWGVVFRAGVFLYIFFHVFIVLSGKGGFVRGNYN